MSRTSTLTSRVSPTRRTWRSWMARSSFTCTVRGISVISSRNSVPPSAALERVGNGQLQLVELERLGDVVVGAELHRLDGRLRGGEGGHHQHDGPRRELLGGLQHTEAVDLPHAEIGDDQVEALALE